MKYRKDRYGNDISALGFGCMRFPQKLGHTDMAETEQEIMAAYEAGINYFDTAYIYTGSEAALGTILDKNGIRDKVKIADKLPHYLIRNEQQLEKYFNEHLQRLKTNYIDYYLMHMLMDVPTWERLKGLGIEKWIEEKKASGAIKQIGFSYHGNSDMFCQLVDAYDWDFCYIQYNYLDEFSQAGRKGLQHAYEKGMSVFIMEPLRGGKLVNNLSPKVQQVFDSHEKHHTPAWWAFNWLWDQKEITCVLSGMNSMAMLEENIKTASESEIGSFTQEDQDMLKKVVEAINSNMKVGCTGCGYCMPCPFGVDIPGTFSAYNTCYAHDKKTATFEYLKCTAMRKDSAAASMCKKCGKCETHCPQSIPIRSKLEEASKVLEGPFYKMARKMIKLFKLY